MKFNPLKSLLLAASFMMAPAANAAGMIVIDPITPMPGVTPVPHIMPLPQPGHTTPRPGGRPLLKGGVSFGLRLQGADIKVDINDQVAKTYITQTFINDTDRNLAGTYLFPLPDDTTFSSFSLHIDGKPVEGKILEAQEARTEYESIVRRMVDPGLLEYADYKTVRARIFPIPAHGTKKVELEYTQLLKAENGLLKYKFPLKTDNDNAPADELKVSVKLASRQGLRTIWSPTHTITTTKTNNNTARVHYDEKQAVPDKDFVLYYSMSDKDLAANVLTHKSAGEDGYYLLTLTPPVESKQISGKDIVLVVDTSGSMQGERMAQNKKALKYLIGALNANDRFNIVQFNTDVDQFREHLVTASAENKKAAESYVDDLEARGGTNLSDALHSATSMLNGSAGTANGGGTSTPAYLVLMTDGEPTVGETTTAKLLDAVKSKRDIRVFDFGVGYDVNTLLLNKLASEHHGTSEYVEKDENLETALASFYQKIKSPVLSNVKIAYDGIEVKDVYPREVKDIFAGSQVMLIGKYKGAGNATVRLTGAVNGVQKAYSFPVSFAAEQSGNTYLPRLWAMRRIGHLTDVAQENGNSREVVDEIVALSKKYGIISQYTSFLVTEPNDRVANSPMPVPVAMGVGVRTSEFRSVPRSNRDMHKSSPIGSPRALAPSSPASADGFVFTLGDAERGASFGGASNSRRERAGWYAPPREAQIIDERPMVGNVAQVSGKIAVKNAIANNKFKDSANLALNTSNAHMKAIEDKTFYLINGYWTDSAYTGKESLTNISFGSKEYFDLVKSNPGIAKFLAVGRQVIIMYNGRGYRITFNMTT